MVSVTRDREEMQAWIDRDQRLVGELESRLPLVPLGTLREEMEDCLARARERIRYLKGELARLPSRCSDCGRTR